MERQKGGNSGEEQNPKKEVDDIGPSQGEKPEREIYIYIHLFIFYIFLYIHICILRPPPFSPTQPAAPHLASRYSLSLSHCRLQPFREGSAVQYSILVRIYYSAGNDADG